MEMQLQSLIDKIKKEGIEKASEKEKQIIDNATTQADLILKEAKKKAEEILTKAQQEIDNRSQAANLAVEQAGRDMIIAVNKTILTSLESLLSRQIDKDFRGNELLKILNMILEKWSQHSLNDPKKFELWLSEEDHEILLKGTIDLFRKELNPGMNIKPEGNIRGGFKICEKEKGVIHDITSSSLAEMLIQYLSPNFQSILNTYREKNTVDSKP